MSSLGQENGGIINRNRQVMTAFHFFLGRVLCVCEDFQNQLSGEGLFLRALWASRWKCPAGLWTCKPGTEEKSGGCSSRFLTHP